ncbi:MAG: DUF389 domain-containing protein [Microcella sp.]|uniref:DUF389 domain-containing protein n=1 Tax=Microcella sp. TaxID=1913979 RepID=UPI0024CCE5BF|nr:DUF389 domain-containing protein [Microcella sp.]UYN83562.1 MAG: DUF389 domain-containing protein [Microcella sp.]
MESRFATPLQMRESVFFDGPEAAARHSRFWLLLVLSAIIASAGVVADSTAAVIGAMIVAPLLGPIQGTMLATVLGDRANLMRSMLLVIAGAAAAVAIGYLIGLTVTGDVVAATNSQVAGRVSPRLIDLLAALGTGVVGSVALVRRDISDTLPGVAIAISLVPPLTVVGLTLESGAWVEALGALLLFVTNVVAIIATGIVVMSIYGVNRLAAVTAADGAVSASLRKPAALLAAMLIVIGLPLTFTSADIASRSLTETAVHDEVNRWSVDAGWSLTNLIYSRDEITVYLEGPLPLPETESLEAALTARGVDVETVRLVLVPVYEVRLGD